MGANSFFIDILLFGELMGPLSVIRYPLTGFVRQGKAVRYVLIAASGLYDGMMYLQKQRAQAPLSPGLRPQSGLVQRAYGMPQGGIINSIAAKRQSTTLSCQRRLSNLRTLRTLGSAGAVHPPL